MTLTKGLDNIAGTAGNDTIVASISADAELQTMSTIDAVNGGSGVDTFKISAAKALATSDLANISNVEIIQVEGASTVTLDTSAIVGVTNLNINKAVGAVQVTAAATTDIAVALKEDGAVAIAANKVDGGNNVTVTATAQGTTANFDTIVVGNAKAAAGNVTINSTAAAATNAVDLTMGAITVTGGKTISVTQKAGDASGLVAGGASATHTLGKITVTGNAATTEVTVTQDATANFAAGSVAKAAVTEVASVKFVALANAASVTVGGLTFTASKALTANEVAQAFANLSATAAKPVGATGDTQGSGIVANGKFTNSLAAAATFNSAAASGDTVVFTAAKGGAITDLAATGATVTVTTQGADEAKAVAAKLAVVAGEVAIVNSAAMKTVTVDGYGTSSAITGTATALETLTLKNGGAFTVASSNATLALNLEKIAVASDITFTAAPTTINVNTIGDNHAHIKSAAIETLNVSGSGVLRTEVMNVGALKTVTVTGTAGLTLATNQSGTVTSVNTTGTTGTVEASIDGTMATYTGGAGVDTVTLATATALTKAINLGAGNDTLVFGVAVTGSTAALNGGDGVDTLSMTTANADALDASAQSFYTNFEHLTINNSFGTADATPETLTLDLAKLGFTNYVTTSGTNTTTANDTLVLDNMATNGTVVLTANGLVQVNVTNAATGLTDVLNTVLSSTGNLTAGTLTAANVETINISTIDTEVVIAPAVQEKNVDTLTLTADKATTVHVTGAADLTLTMTGSTNVTSIDGSAMTGGLTVTSLNTTSATTITGGSGNDVLTAATGTTADILLGGAGNDTLVANKGLSTLTGGAGNDIFQIGVASANVNSYSSITDFAAGDLLQMTGATQFAAAKVTLGDTAVFQDFANAAVNVNDASNAVTWFQFSGNTYVVQDADNATVNFVNGTDFIVKLTGLVDLSNASFNSTHSTIALV